MISYQPASTGGGGGTAGPETDPVAVPIVVAHRASTDHDAHNDGRYTPTAHQTAVDPHGDRDHSDAGDSSHLAAVDPHGANTHSDGQLSAHVSAVDPHGDRSAAAAHADSADQAHVVAADPHGSIAALNTHKAAVGAHAAPNISFDDTGLIIVKGANVKAALAAADTWMNARPTKESGLIAGLPANGSRPNGSTYFATDEYGGHEYEMVAGAWVPNSAGVLQASGQIIAGPVQFVAAGLFDVKAIGVTVTDIPGGSINVPASARPVLLRHKWETNVVTGTAAAASYISVRCAITDAANNIVAFGAATYVQVTTASISYQGQITLEAYLPAPVAAATYKLRAWLSNAAPANWSSALLQPSNGAAGADNFYAMVA